MHEETVAQFDDLARDATQPVDTLPEKVQKKSTKSQEELDGDQRRTLRYGIAIAVVVVLSAELVGTFMIVVWQGRGHFKLNEWMFSFLTNGVLLQTFFGFRTIITHLFPVEGGKLPSDKT